MTVFSPNSPKQDCVWSKEPIAGVDFGRNWETDIKKRSSFAKLLNNNISSYTKKKDIWHWIIVFWVDFAVSFLRNMKDIFWASKDSDDTTNLTLTVYIKLSEKFIFRCAYSAKQKVKNAYFWMWQKIIFQLLFFLSLMWYGHFSTKYK